MRWLLVKDLQILRRSPLLVALLVLYPIVIAALVGFAVTSGPGKPKVAFLNEVPREANVVDLGGEKVDVTREARPLFEAIDPVRVRSRQEALQKVKDGDVHGLAAEGHLVRRLRHLVEKRHAWLAGAGGHGEADQRGDPENSRSPSASTTTVSAYRSTSSM